MRGAHKVGVVALASGLLALAAGAAAAPLPKVEGLEPDKWLIDNAEVVTVTNVKQVMTSDLMKKGGKEGLKELIKSNPQLKEVIDATGLDVTKDIDGVVGSAAGAGKSARALLVVRGNFDTDKLNKALAKKSGRGKSKKGPDGADGKPGEGKYKDKDAEGKGEKVGDYTVYPIEIQERGMYAVVADKNTLILSHSKEEAVSRARNGGKTAAKISKNMDLAVRKFTGKESMVLAMLVTEDMKKQMERAPQVAGLVSSMKTVSASLVVSDSLNLTVQGYTGDAKSARRLQAQLELYKAAGAALLAGQDDLPPAVLDVINEVKIEATKDSAVIKVKVSREQLEKIAKGDDK